MLNDLSMSCNLTIFPANGPLHTCTMLSLAASFNRKSCLRRDLECAQLVAFPGKHKLPERQKKLFSRSSHLQPIERPAKTFINTIGRMLPARNLPALRKRKPNEEATTKGCRKQ